MKDEHWYSWLPIYEVWTADKSNFTPIGFVLLYIPWLLFATVGTIVMCTLFCVMMILIAPIIGFEEYLEKQDKKYNLSIRMSAAACSVSAKLKLLRRC